MILNLLFLLPFFVAGQPLVIGVGLMFSTYSMTTSTDAVNWSPSVPSTFNVIGSCIAYGQGRWLAAGGGSSGSTVVYSNDGNTWNPVRNMPLTAVGSFFAQSGVGMWMAAGSGTCGTIATSTDGIVWGGCTTAARAPAYAVAYGQSKWVVGGTSPAELAYSTNAGASWTTVTGVMDAVFSVAYSQARARWVAVGRGPLRNGFPDSFASTLAYSSDATSWTLVPPSRFNADTGNAVIYNAPLDLWLAVGSRTFLTSSSGYTTGVMATSRDGGITWTTAQNAYPFNATTSADSVAIVSATTFGAQFVIGANYGPAPNSHCLATSTDGLSWTLVSSFQCNRVNGLAAGLRNISTTSTTRPAEAASMLPSVFVVVVLVVVAFAQ